MDAPGLPVSVADPDVARSCQQVRDQIDAKLTVLWAKRAVAETLADVGNIERRITWLVRAKERLEDVAGG